MGIWAPEARGVRGSGGGGLMIDVGIVKLGDKRSVPSSLLDVWKMNRQQRITYLNLTQQ